MSKLIMNKEYDLWWASLSDSYSMNMCEIYRQTGSTEELFNMDRSSLCKLKGVSEAAADYIINRRNRWDYEKISKSLEDNKIAFLPWYDNEFPKKLLQTKGYPFGIFYRGLLPDEKKPCVAVIGSRECSEYGRGVAGYFGAGLSIAGVQIVSGMAMGIDGLSQLASLNAGGKSFGVLGSGVDKCYPNGNRNLYSKLIKHGGVISEYGPGADAISWHFPRRNRIISALCDVLLVVEAKKESGTMITVDCALEQGKDVMVVPGRITDPLSVGCLRLMKEGAMPAFDVESVLEILSEKYEFSSGKDKTKDKMEPESENLMLEREENIVYSCLGLYARNVEEIRRDTNLGYQTLIKSLMQLELKGYIKEVSKGHYIRLFKEDVDLKEATDGKISGNCGVTG